MSSKYYVTEIHRVVTQITSFLSEHKYIGISEYIELIQTVGSGMTTKLRLTPDSDLSLRLSHLYAICLCASGSDPIFEDQIVVSVENINPIFSFDCDLILERAGKTYLIDFTSTSDPQILSEKQRVLQSRASDPSIADRVVEPLVYRFSPERFHVSIEWLCREPNIKNPETFTLNLFEFMARKSHRTNEHFIRQCDRVKEYAASKIIQSDFKHSNYSSIKLSQDKVNLAAISAGSNVVSDTCNIFLNVNKKQYAPFIESLKLITAQYHKKNSSFIHRQADIIQASKTLEDRLRSLALDPLAKVLLNALLQPSAIIGIDHENRTHTLISFPTSSTNKRMLRADSNIKIAAKHVKGHYFKILFSFDAMDDQLRRSLASFTKASQKIPSGSKASIDECIEQIKIAERSLNNITRVLSKKLTRKPHSTIFSKVITLCSKSKVDSGNVGLLANNLLSTMAAALDNTVCGSLIAHLYEITKTFSFSIKNSHKDETYYVGFNGPFDSITITKMSATQDSFERLHYCVISKFSGNEEYEDICWRKHHKSGSVSRSHFRTMDTNDVSYNLRIPYYLLSLLTWDVETSLDKGRFSQSDLPEKITNSTLHTLVNRDTFSQAAQQVRYLYISSMGYGADASKIVDKITFFRPKFVWEYVYIIRMIKLGLSLSILRDSESLGLISERGELSVVFPHTSRVAQSFNEVVSSMYYCNVFNKFRAYHEVSEAFCYNELDEENDIYNKARAANPDNLAGFSYKTMMQSMDIDYLLSESFVKNECDFVDNLIESGPGRFKASCAVIISCSKQYVPHNDNHISQIYRELNKSPIEACTLRGAMEQGKATDKSQGCRAASAILEELFRQYDIEPARLNNNSWLHTVFMQKVEESGGDASIFSLVSSQLADEAIEYIYRIVQKDQIGNREISVLNAVFRLGALFVETISRSLSELISDVDLLENKDKDYQFETAVKTAEEKVSKSGDTLCFDNSDQKRWGPNHMLNIFCAMFYGILHKERGLLRIIYFVADKVLQKQAKFPESLIKLFGKYTNKKSGSVRINRDGLDADHGSETLKKFFSSHANDLINNKYSTVFPYGMCQGIFHATSSVYHAIMCKFIEDICSKIFGKSVTISSFCTSDDSSRIITISQGKHRVATIKQIHAVVIMAGILFNIIRNDAKSAFNFYIAEFNSIFFKKGIMATPSLKQRISKIDVGSGSNHVEDYLTSLSASANYFTSGGSYVGAWIVSILNITLHTEQWSRWDRLNDSRYYFPVELDGFPVIEPITTCLSGAIANLFLRSSDVVGSDVYAKIFSSIVSETPDEFSLSDYNRIPRSLSEDASRIKIFKNSGALGLHSLARTDKKLSQFEKRHKMSQWNFPDHFLTLRKNTSDARFFLYNIYKNGCMSLFHDSLGVNSFYKRFTDPWLSSARKCVKVSKGSILVAIGLDPEVRYSYDEISEALAKIDAEYIRSYLISMSKNVNVTQFTQNLIDQLIPRLDDAKAVLDFLNSQECSEYLEPKDTPATSRVTLRNHEALDQEKYTADLIKVLSGEKSRILITELYNDHRKFDTLPTAAECPNLDLKDAILIAENSIHAFNKYIKRDTKMITSGKPTNLSDLVTRVLRSRFFEGLGIRITGTLKLIGDRSHAFSYTSWYRALNEKSKDYSNIIINHSCRQLYSDVVKYGIISTQRVLSQRDQFEIVDSQLTAKHMKISSTSRSSLIAFCKSWLSANLTYSFSYDALVKLFRGQLIGRNGIRVSQDKFVRNAQKMYFDMTVNGLPVIHLLETDTRGDSNVFRHVFLTESSSTEGIVDIELTDLGKQKVWASDLIKSIPLTSNIISNRSYRVPKSHDEYIFIPIDTATVFTLDIPAYTASICLQGSNFTIPICHSDAKVIEAIRLGYVLKHEDLSQAVQIYSSILDITNEFKVINPILATSLNYILYKTNASSKVSVINRHLSYHDFGYQFGNIHEVDIFKALLLGDNYTSINVSASKLFNYVNNLFKSPDYREGYIMSITDDDNLALKLGDIIREDDSDDNLALADTEYYVEDQEEEVETDSEDDSSDNSDIVLLNDDIDDIDFEAFGEEDVLEPNENYFQFLDVSYKDSDPEEKVFQSSRTGITVNPNSEFPYAIMKYIQKWRSDNKLVMIRGITTSNSGISSIPNAYLTAYRLFGSVPDNLLHRLTRKTEVELPCCLSDVVTIERVIA